MTQEKHEAKEQDAKKGQPMAPSGWDLDSYEGNFVPVQADGDDAHWRLSVFGDELMVAGWVYPYKKKVSDLTRASMSDLSYEVNGYAADESYMLPRRSAAKMAEANTICQIEHYPIRKR